MAGLSVTPIGTRILDSRGDFLDHVWPIVSPAFGPGRLVPVEGSNDAAARELDMLGIDYLFIPLRGEPYGVSQRTGEGCWRTVTMGKRALSRLESIWGRTGAITPAVHVQAYLVFGDDGRKTLDAVTVLRMGQFMSYVEKHPGKAQVNRLQGTTFYSWTFSDLSAVGVSALTIPAPDLQDALGPKPQSTRMSAPNDGDADRSCSATSKRAV